MRIAIVCNDTRGGVQPYVALARALKAAGHDVRALAPAGLDDIFGDAGIAASGLTGSAEELAGLVGGVAERGSLAAMRLAAVELPRRLKTWTREALAVCEGADVVTGGVGGMVVALSVAEKIGAPFIEAHLQPIGRPTTAYPGVMASAVPAWLGGLGRITSHYLSELAVWVPFQGAMAAAREEVLGLKGRPRAADGQPVLYAFSRHVAPLPPDPRRPRHVTGYWALSSSGAWAPPAALEAFLRAPGPVVSIGFGSMGSQRPEDVSALVLAAIRKAGVRAVLLSGWGGMTEMPEAPDAYFAQAVPHDWLFPRMDAVVHHGGAGTTGAGFLSGKPAIVVPFTMDQPFWAARVAALGAGPAPIPRARLTSDRLAQAIRRATTDAVMQRRAADLGELTRGEPGTLAAVEILETVHAVRYAAGAVRRG